jgi:glycosyltransferase involved in cell wall biosynthesis
MSSPTITVAICSYNRCDSLRESIRSLCGLETRDQFTFEIVVVDDGSTDQTREVVAELRDHAAVDVRYFHQPGLGIAVARNHCVRESRGEWIAFFDDDQQAESDWLANLLEFARDRDLPCVGSARTLLIQGIEPERLPRVTRAVLGELNHSESHRCEHRPMLSTGTVLIHRSVFDDIGGFDETLHQGGSDSDLFARMRRAGVAMWFTPSAVCRHVIPSHRLRPKFLWWCSRRNGVSFARQDLKDYGRLRSCLVATVRLGRTALVVLPRAAWHRVRGRIDHAVADFCLASRDAGYAQRVLSELMPRRWVEARLSKTLDYRNERVMSQSVSG